MESSQRERVSIYDLQTLYEEGSKPDGDPTKKEPLENLMRAWKAIKERDPSKEDSFFSLAGYHGEPFRGEGETDPAWWGGYCQHGTILFPTWHRVLLLKLEDALRSVPKCENVTLPYWDVTSADALEKGIPWPLTDEFFVLDNNKIANPLRSFVLPLKIVDSIKPQDPGNMTKPQGYETVRYPLAGLFGTEDAINSSKEYNRKYPDYQQNVKILNGNVQAWVSKASQFGVYKSYEDCLKAPNYTVFSNMNSANQWGKENRTQPAPMSLEIPHNCVHLAVGGFVSPAAQITDVPITEEYSDQASGDMGANEVAAFDPIFYFHHCNVDRVFWLWQTLNSSTTNLEIIPGYRGTNTSDRGVDPTVGQKQNQVLDLNTPLLPFKKKNQSGEEVDYTSNDAIDINALGYTYSQGSFSIPKAVPMSLEAAAPEPMTKLVVSNIDRTAIPGSFIVKAAIRTSDNQTHFLGSEAVLSRWQVKNCPNCTKNLTLEIVFDVPERLKDGKPEVTIQTFPIAPSEVTLLEKFENMKQNIKTEIL